MDGIGFEAKAQEDRLHAEFLLKRADDGDAAAAPGGDWGLAEGLLHGFMRCLVGLGVGGRNVGHAPVEEFSVHLDGFRGHLLKVLREEFGDLLVVLVRHESHADFGVGARRDNGLGALARVAAPDAVDIAGGADARALNGGEAVLALQGRHADGVHVLLLAEGRFVHGLALLGRNDLHIVVEARDGDVAVGVDELADHLAEHVGWVGHCPAIDPRVQVGIGALHLYLHVAQAPQPNRDGGDIAGEHRGVGHQDHVGLDQLLMVIEPQRQRARANLLLALQHELDVAGQRMGGHHELEGLGVHEALPLVVIGPATPDVAILDHGLEGLGAPLIDGVHGHDIVVPVDQDRGQLLIEDLLPIDHRGPYRGHHLGPIGPGFQQRVAPVFRGAYHVLRVRGLGAD